MGCGLSQLSRSQRVRVCDFSSGGQKSLSTSPGPEMSPDSMAAALAMDSGNTSATLVFSEGSRALLADGSRRASHYYGATNADRRKRGSRQSSSVSSGSSSLEATAKTTPPTADDPTATIALPSLGDVVAITRKVSAADKDSNATTDLKISQLREQIALITRGKVLLAGKAITPLANPPPPAATRTTTLDESQQPPGHVKAPLVGRETEKDRTRSSVSVKSFSDRDSGYKDDSQPEEGAFRLVCFITSAKWIWLN